MKKVMVFIVLAIVFISSAFGVSFDPHFRDLTGPVEIVFVIDTSGSMGAEILEVLETIDAFAAALVDSGYDFKLGAVTFADGADTWDFDTTMPGYQMTEDFDAFRTRLDAVCAWGGGDYEETSIDGIYAGATDYSWSPDVLKVLIMFTDAGFHEPGDGTLYSDVTYEECLRVLITEGFVVYDAFNLSSVYGEDSSAYVQIADTTGGESYSIFTPWDSIFADVFTDVTRYCCLGATVGELAFLDLIEIELDGPDDYETFCSRTINLTGEEFEGLDEIYVSWTMIYSPSTRAKSSSPNFMLTLRTESGEFYGQGEVPFEIPTGISEGEIPKPQKFNLLAYPNPFNSSVRIDLEGIDAALVQIEIYDINGKLIKDLVSPYFQFPESHSLSFSWQPDESISTGVYLVRAKFGDHKVLSQKLVYLK